jgi:GT2 family glycosyltransferase/glycosyltransferase involved in cell wall biosynthesis
MRFQLERIWNYLADVFGELPKRAWLTLKYQGPLEVLIRIVTFPIRLTPWGPRLGYGKGRRHLYAELRRWYRRRGRPVAVVIPTYGDPTLTIETVKSVQKTVDRDKVRIIVCDDGTPEEQLVPLRELKGIELIESEANQGFAVNCNRGIAAAGELDVILLNNDVVAHKGWLEGLQHMAYAHAPDVGIAGPKLLYEDGTIQSAGSYRNLGAPEWFDHRYRFRPRDYEPANVPSQAIAMTGACMYLRRALLEQIGLLDERFAMAYEDVDICLRAWEAGWTVWYTPNSVLTHHESKTRGGGRSDREIESQQYFWEKWGDWFDARDVRTPDGALKVIYVTEDTGVGGGHRVIFEHLNGLKARGHEPELWSLDGPPDWFDLGVPVRRFRNYRQLMLELEKQDAIKVASWWATAPHVWRASVRRGIPAYFVQDIETSYYPGRPDFQRHVLASYRQEFRFITTSGWVAEQLRELGLDPLSVPPGIDLANFRELDGAARRANVLLSLGRTQPLKNLPLTIDAWKSIPSDRRPELWLFGIEPQVGRKNGVTRYIERPSDAQVNELLNTATALIQTSTHEGFCLPLLEAMAAGAPVICTDAHGNRDFCRDGENCLMVEPEPKAVAAAIEHLLDDAELRARLTEAGRRTAAAYAWEPQIDKLERFFEEVAGDPATAPPRSAAPRG